MLHPMVGHRHHLNVHHHVVNQDELLMTLLTVNLWNQMTERHLVNKNLNRFRSRNQPKRNYIDMQWKCVPESLFAFIFLGSTVRIGRHVIFQIH